MTSEEIKLAWIEAENAWLNAHLVAKALREKADTKKIQWIKKVEEENKD